MNEAVATNLVKEKGSIKEKAYLGIKRVFDICVSLVGMLFLIPSIIFVKLAYLLSGDTHTIFYSQKRIGKDGREFNFYKFRSMLVDSEEILENTLKMDPIAREEYKTTKKLKNDPRVTKVGKLIRKTSIDELPQLINIFKGDMSLIGNRPYLPREKEDMGPFYESIVKSKPGLTGYWQVNGRSNTTFEKRLELESYYSNHCNLGMDIKIFFKTFTAVLFHKGAE